MFENVKAVLFDMDGTLIDSVGVWNDVDTNLISCCGDCLPGCDVQKQRDSYLSMAKSDPNPYLSYCGYLGEKYGFDMTAEEIMAKRYEIARDFLINRVSYKEGAAEFVKLLKGCGIRCAIVSSTRRDNMEIYRMKNRRIKAEGDIDGLFEMIYTREDAPALKPDPAIYLKALEEMNLSAAECIAFEDSLIGAAAAAGAGIRTVSVYDRYSKDDAEKISRLTERDFADFNEAAEVFLKERKQNIL